MDAKYLQKIDFVWTDYNGDFQDLDMREIRNVGASHF